MSALEGIDVEDTFVLGWHYDPEIRTLRFEVEASLLPRHPDYRQPKPEEWACYRRAVLAFDAVRKINGLLSQSSVRPDLDPDGSEDYGSFDTLSQDDGRYQVSGRFGKVTVECERVSLRSSRMKSRPRMR